MTPSSTTSPRTTHSSAAGASPAGFAAYPASWYYFGKLSEIESGPVSRDMFGQRLVAFRTDSGQVSVLDARCSHLGTDLGCGRVVGEHLQCPYHNWEYGVDGRCARIPATSAIPAFARQRGYPVAQRHGQIYVFNGRQALFPLPFYEGVQPEELLCSEPYDKVLECPWYMIGGNAFDAQHFAASHDRVMVGEATIDCPGAFSRRATARFAVSGHSLQDRVTRLLAGNEVTLSVTDYCGNMMLVTSTFRRTRSYGLIVTMPLAENRVLIRVMVMARRSRHFLGRILIDRASVAIRRKFITNFLSADAVRLSGVHYNPARMIAADRILQEYFQWLAVVSHGRAAVEATTARIPAGEDAADTPSLPHNLEIRS